MEPVDARAGTGATAASQRIVTPEAVILDLERAGVASRTLAFVLDILALGAVLLGLGIALGQVLGGIEGVGGAVFAIIFSVGAIVVWFCAWETLWRGRTPGKAALGLRAVRLDGTTIRFQQAFVRAAVGLIDIFVPPVGFTAVVSALLSPRDQRLGDMAAGTLVVRERSAQSRVVPAWFTAPPGYEGYVASLDVSAMDEDAYGVVRTYLLRYGELTPAAREHLALRIANPLALRLDHTPPRWLHPYMFLVCLAAAWQRAHGAPVPPPPPPTWR
jgi:uncharacterized RDD family membrane protein YckC